MRLGFRPFGEKATASPSSAPSGLSGQFDTARWRLTSIYLILLGAVLLMSSSVTYSAFSRRLEHRFARFPTHPDVLIFEISSVPQPAQVRADLVNTLVLVNGILLVVGGFFSYWFAGLTLRPIQASYDEQRRFLSNASHELRTPLAILQATLENEKLTNAAARPRLQSSLEEVERMGRLVNDLLILSRLDEDAQLPELSQLFLLSETLQETVQRLRPLADSHQVHLTVQEPLPELTLKAPRDLVIRVIENVIKNAIVYNKPQGSVTLLLRLQGQQAVVEVRDTGVGIAAKDQPHVLQRFYRLDKSRSRQTGGSGLGLAIVKSVMDHLGGNLTFTSTPDVGSTFALHFPIHKTSSFLHPPAASVTK